MKKNTFRDSFSQRAVISTGTSTLVLIFVLLCLLTFSVLSLASARANMRLSQKSADRTTAYYQAENRANDVLIRVIDCLNRNASLSDEEAFLKGIRSELEGKEGISFTGDSTLTWTVPLAENQYLKAEIAVSYTPLPDGRHYQVTGWNTYTDYDWGAEKSLPVLEGAAFPDIQTEEN